MEAALVEAVEQMCVIRNVVFIFCIGALALGRLVRYDSVETEHEKTFIF